MKAVKKKKVKSMSFPFAKKCDLCFVVRYFSVSGKLL